MKGSAIMSGLLVSGLVLSAVPGAQAGPRDWDVGGAFRVGGLSFSIGYGRHDSLQPDYYYRVNAPLVHPRRTCGRACFRRGDSYYHHSTCPLLLGHFRRYGYDVHDSFDRSGPVVIWRWGSRSPPTYSQRPPRGRRGARGRHRVPPTSPATRTLSGVVRRCVARSSAATSSL